MSVSASVVTVAATATLLTASQGDNAFGASLALQVPSGGATVFIGGADVTAAAGWPVTAGQSLFLDLDSTSGGNPQQTEAVYGIVATGTQAVNVLLRGV